MSKVSFADDNLLLSDCYVKRDYRGLKNMILERRFEVTDVLTEEGEWFGYHVTKNQPLSALYHMDCYVVKFLFSYVSTLHMDRQEQILHRLLMKLKGYIDSHQGYYNLRIPTHIVDLLKAVNEVFPRVIFCGGTVEVAAHGKQIPYHDKSNLEVAFADQRYIEAHRAELINIAVASFRDYHGQYHISPVTQDKAGLIYENWMKGSLEALGTGKVVVAKKKEFPVGVVTTRENGVAVEGILSAVAPSARELGVYKEMIIYLVNYAYGKKKGFVISTQFDNFIVQGVWNSLGLKPFYSIYNIHIDNRDSGT